MKATKRMGKFAALFLTICVMLAAIPFNAFAANIGDRLGDVLYTDIKAYVNGYQIPSYNVNNYMCVRVQDLNSYGFSAIYNNATRSTSISLAPNQKISPIAVQPVSGGRVGQPVGSYVYTDITCYINGQKIDSFNINGNLVIYFRSLGALGTINYIDAERASRLTTAVVPTPTPSSTLYSIGGTVAADGLSDTSTVLVTLKNSSGTVLANVYASGGRFNFGGYPAGTYTVEASLSGYTTASQSVALSGSSIGSLAIRLAKSVQNYTISGRVLDRDSRVALPSATVILRYSNGTEASRVTTDSYGAYAFTVTGTGNYYSIDVSRPGYSNATTGSFVVSANTTRDVDLVKSGSYTVTGTIYDANGRYTMSATVRLRDSSGNALASVSTGSNGVYTFYNVAYGNYSLEVSASGYSTQTSSTFTVNGNVANQNFYVNGSSSTGSYTVTGYVYDEYYNRGASARVELYSITRGTTHATSTSDSNGRYYFYNVPYGVYYVRAYTSADESRSNEFTVSGSYTVDGIYLYIGGNYTNDGYALTVNLRNNSEFSGTVNVHIESGNANYADTDSVYIASGVSNSITFFDIPAGNYYVDGYTQNSGSAFDSVTVSVSSGNASCTLYVDIGD